jgi:hypothetical protein
MEHSPSEKITVPQLVKKFPAFCGTRNFITEFTRTRHVSLPWASSIQSMKPIPLLEDPSWHYPPIYAWVSQVVSFPQVSLSKSCIQLSSPHSAICPAHLILIFDDKYRSLSSLVLFKGIKICPCTCRGLIVPLILNLGTCSRWVVSLMLWLHYSWRRRPR